MKGNLILSGKDPGEKMDVTLAYCSRFPTLHTFHIIKLFGPDLMAINNLGSSKGKIEDPLVWLALCSVVDPSNAKVNSGKCW